MIKQSFRKYTPFSAAHLKGILKHFPWVLLLIITYNFAFYLR